MAQLTLGDILDLACNLTENGMSHKEMCKIPIYIGDDEELNGIHAAFYTGIVDPDDENSEYYISLIEDSFSGAELDGKAILIS